MKLVCLRHLVDNGDTMFRYSCWALVLFSSVMSAPTSAFEPKSNDRIAIALCTGDSSRDGKRFVQMVSPFLKFSTVTFETACPDADQRSGEDRLYATVVRQDDSARLEISGVVDGQFHKGYQRSIPWPVDDESPLKSIEQMEKQVAFALLLETLLFDFEHIRLMFEPDEPAAQPTGAASPEDRSSESESTVPTPEEPSSAPEPAAPKKESREVDEKRSAAPVLEMSPSTLLAVMAGIDYMTEKTIAIEIDIHYIRSVGRARLMAAISASPWSNFTIQSRPFQTLFFGGRIGGGMAILERGPLSLVLVATFLVRTNIFRRENISSATRKTWVDIGAGAALSMHLALTRRIGMLLCLGIDLYPSAREVEIEDGPRERFGLVAAPTKIGISIAF